MGKTDWERHRSWLRKNALPKKVYSEKWKKGPRVPLGRLTRFKVLAQPRYRCRKFDGAQRQPISNVKRAALLYEVSQRTRLLARVLERFRRDKFHYDYRPASTVTPNALNAECSERTMTLAEPKASPKSEPVRKDTKYGVAPNALAYTATERIGKLAQPKPLYVSRHEEEDELIVIEERELTEHGVSTTALKYKATARIIEMATAREPPMDPVPEFPYDDKPRTKYNVAANALKYKISDRILEMSKPR